ncbi:MAG: hypothetical protein HOE53_02545 [Candidatus Magasanikbacteria bacterium]|jgi:hypothetical protein|nr:hypothetical protein [Candidatus Magasanikbacteria bacterium]
MASIAQQIADRKALYRKNMGQLKKRRTLLLKRLAKKISSHSLQKTKSSIEKI